MAKIFVFGSNLLGIHGKGAALSAVQKHGAIRGQAVGIQGNSYAIPTKKTPNERLSQIDINKYVAEFLLHARDNPQNIYNVTPIGCGLAGYFPYDIAPMFQLVRWIPNINLPKEFAELLPGMSY